MVFLWGEGRGVTPSPYAWRRGHELVKNKETTWSKLNLVCLYIENFSVFETIKSSLANQLTTLSAKWPTMIFNIWIKPFWLKKNTKSWLIDQQYIPDDIGESILLLQLKAAHPNQWSAVFRLGTIYLIDF